MTGKVGVALHEIGAANQVAAIELAERHGIPSAWLTTGGVGPDAMVIFGAAAMRTERITLGTAIIPSYPRHPLALAQQAITLAQLAPERFRLGVGPSHRPGIEGTFGIPMERPLEHLREYVTVLKGALQGGTFDFEGKHFKVKGRVAQPPQVPVLISALRPGSFELAGEVSDGALAWICPLPYLVEKARPALHRGADKGSRAEPPLIAHCFAAVHYDAAEVRATARERLAVYPRLPFYQQMFVEAGFSEATKGEMSDGMLDAVVVHGDAPTVGRRLREYLDAGMDELMVSLLVVGDDRKASMERTMDVVASL